MNAITRKSPATEIVNHVLQIGATLNEVNSSVRLGVVNKEGKYFFYSQVSTMDFSDPLYGSFSKEITEKEAEEICQHYHDVGVLDPENAEATYKEFMVSKTCTAHGVKVIAVTGDSGFFSTENKDGMSVKYYRADDISQDVKDMVLAVTPDVEFITDEEKAGNFIHTGLETIRSFVNQTCPA